MSATADTTALGAFLQSFTAFENRMVQSKIREEKTQLGALLKSYRSLESAIAPFRKLEAPQYNLFEILHIRHLEARVHTPYLGNLLNPNASHNQGDLFLREFLCRVAERPDWAEGLKHLQVVEEMGTEKGIIDLIIRGWNHKGPFGIVVENKVYAHDQAKQLERYHHYLAHTLGLPPDRYQLIYLSPHGAAPDIPHSICPALYQSLRLDHRLVLRSYHKDIREWLEATLPLVPAPKVKHTLRQYLEIINRL